MHYSQNLIIYTVRKTTMCLKGALLGIITCLREFLFFSLAVHVKAVLFKTNQTWFDVNGDTISKNEF